MVEGESQPRKDAQPAAQERSAAGLGGYSARILVAEEEALEAYRSACQGAVFAPPQSPLWARAWLRGQGRNGLIALIQRRGAPALALALEVVAIGPLRIARFAGGRHANGNFPAVNPNAFADGADQAAAVRALIGALQSGRPEIDMLAFERQREAFQQCANPLLAFPHSASPNLSLAVDLSEGFDKLLRDKRRRRRRQLRQMEAAGGYRRLTAASKEEVEEVLELLFAWKSVRLNRMGVHDIFGSDQVRASFRRLFVSALEEPQPSFFLHALEVGGKIRAITCSSRTAESIICEISTFCEDELAYASPGDFLFYENIAEAAAEGLAFYDFGVGDELYKRLWCDVETRHADVFIGLTPLGRAAAQANFAVAGVKRAIKQNPTLAKLARRARQMSAKSQAQEN
ncbi:GNAT family N-acetyltransferase [Chelativorans oligotrophicus]|jgi:CelD/BcsL family acetyltransferase involved in cellulose biosynthesis|uniref:BioF2-like acetyltransferase domain-containing protein n=1 Tax=Chelativorans sp. (strain BNC1) TaxID=266779 RepID=Q11J71_CHESB|nr:GNAT family N-acetyltransferase [Chelativorans oligotrophicus]